MLELLFLLLPVAVYYGWYMGKRSEGEKQLDDYSRLSQKYVTGIQYLLENQPEKASDQFVSLLEIDNNAFETHIALGNLFRQRGEIDRAIALHQKLIGRFDLDHDERNLALLDLARDFITAGLLERAEMILVKLDSKQYRERALHELLDIYTRMQEWDKAIQVARSLDACQSVKIKPLIAHFYCEMADREISKIGPVYVQQAQQYLKQALHTDSKHIRAHLTLAQLEVKSRRYKSAFKHLQNVLSTDIDYLATVMPILLMCYQELNLMHMLKRDMGRFLEQGAGCAALGTLVNQLYQEDKIEQAKTILLRELHRNPTVGAIYHLVEIYLKETQSAEIRMVFNILLQLLAQQKETDVYYRCEGCGFSMQHLFWCCPKCRKWGQIKPVSETSHCDYQKSA